MQLLEPKITLSLAPDALDQNQALLKRLMKDCGLTFAMLQQLFKIMGATYAKIEFTNVQATKLPGAQLEDPKVEEQVKRALRTLS